jgi:transposase
VAVAVDSTGKQLGKHLVVKNDAHTLLALLTWARKIAGREVTSWAIEDGRSFARRLADELLLAGQEVIWVPTRQMAAQRTLHAPTGAKSDAVDAQAVAHAAMASPTLDRHRIDDRVRELRALVDHRSDLVKRRTSVINQVKAQTHVWLDHTPGDLTRTRTVITAETLVTTSQLPAHVRIVLQDMLADINALTTRIRDLDRAIKELVTPLAPTLLEIIGISYTNAAVLIVEVGDITRFANSARLARYTGCAPIPVYSSDQERYRLHRGGNRRLNSVTYTIALVQKRHSPTAQQLLARHEPNKGRRGARRILQRHLVDVIDHAMRVDRASWTHPVTVHQPAA